MEKNLDEITSSLVYTEGGELRAECHCRVQNGKDNISSWEPPADIRGDIARALFYMEVRYEGEDGKTPDLELENKFTKNGSAELGKLYTLLKWHQQNPPDRAEIARDLRIEKLQGNHNSFIAGPNLASTLWGNECK